jgi:hypothetical protein
MSQVDNGNAHSDAVDFIPGSEGDNPIPVNITKGDHPPTYFETEPEPPQGKGDDLIFND